MIDGIAHLWSRLASLPFHSTNQGPDQPSFDGPENAVDSILPSWQLFASRHVPLLLQNPLAYKSGVNPRAVAAMSLLSHVSDVNGIFNVRSKIRAAGEEVRVTIRQAGQDLELAGKIIVNSIREEGQKYRTSRLDYFQAVGSPTSSPSISTPSYPPRIACSIQIGSRSTLWMRNWAAPRFHFYSVEQTR